MLKSFTTVLLLAGFVAACDHLTAEKSKNSKPEEKVGLDFDPAVVELTDVSFEETVMDSDEPWLILFYSSKCPHCKMVAPEFSEAAADFDGDVNFGAVNVFAESELVKTFNITSVPVFGYWDSAEDKMVEDI